MEYLLEVKAMLKNVLQQGKAKFTPLKVRKDQKKRKIKFLGMHQSWNELSDKERNKRKMQSKKLE